LVKKNVTEYNKSHVLEVLKSLPYIQYVEEDKNPKAKGVVYYNKEKACPGLGLIFSDNLNLIDMNGKVLHKWNGGKYFARINKNSEVLVFLSMKRLAKLDWDSKVLWEIKIPTKNSRFDHEINFDEKGNIYTFLTKKMKVDCFSKPIPVKEEFIFILSPDGKIKQKISMWNLFKDMIPQRVIEEMLKQIEKKDFSREVDRLGYEVFSTNSVDIINRDMRDSSGRRSFNLCKKSLYYCHCETLNRKDRVDMGKREGYYWPLPSFYLALQRQYFNL